jgi:hypothetical protein
MQSTRKAIGRYVLSTLGCLIFLTLLASVTSCESCTTHEARDGKLNMTLTPDKLIGNEKTFHLTFSPVDHTKIVEFKNYELKLTLTAESGDITDSKIVYTAVDKLGKGAKQHIEPTFKRDLTHFFPGDVLEPKDNPLETDITIENGPGADKLLLTVELLDITDKNKYKLAKKCEGRWEAGYKIKVTNADKDNKITGEKEIKLEITKGISPITAEELGQLKLSIKRTKGNDMKISGAPDTSELYILSDIPVVTPVILVLEADADKEATFKLQLLNKADKEVGDPVDVHWEKSAQLDFQAEYDDTDPTNKKVNITITNTDKLPLPAGEAKLSWDTNSDDVTVRSNGNASSKSGEQQLPAIPAGGNTTVTLENVTFIPGKVAAELKLTVDWPELDNPVTKTCTLTAKPIKVTVTELKFDKQHNQIKYKIRNDGPEDIDVQVQSANTKPNTENKAIIITKVPFNLHLGPNIESIEQVLQVDLNQEENAEFDFKLFFDKHPIKFKYNDGNGEKTVDSATVPCEAKEVKLKLTNELDNDFVDDKLILQGDKKEIKLKIALDGKPEDVIDLNEVVKNNLRLEVKGVGDTLLKYNNETVGTRILGNSLKVGEADDTMTLTLERQKGNQSSITLQLRYDKKGDGKFVDLGKSLTIEWKEDTFELTPDPVILQHGIIADATGKATLLNKTSEMDPTKTSIVLKSSDKDVKFHFVKQNGDPINDLATGKAIADKATLAQLGNNNLIAKDADIQFYFKLAGSKGQKIAELEISIERDGQEIISKPIKWGATKADMKVEREEDEGDDRGEEEKLISADKLEQTLNELFPKGTEKVTEQQVKEKFLPVLQTSPRVQELKQGVNQAIQYKIQEVQLTPVQQQQVQELLPHVPEVLNKSIEKFVDLSANEIFKGGKKHINRKGLEEALEKVEVNTNIILPIIGFEFMQLIQGKRNTNAKFLEDFDFNAVFDDF